MQHSTSNTANWPAMLLLWCIGAFLWFLPAVALRQQWSPRLQQRLEQLVSQFVDDRRKLGVRNDTAILVETKNHSKDAPQPASSADIAARAPKKGMFRLLPASSIATPWATAR